MAPTMAFMSFCQVLKSSLRVKKPHCSKYGITRSTNCSFVIDQIASPSNAKNSMKNSGCKDVDQLIEDNLDRAGPDRSKHLASRTSLRLPAGPRATGR